MKILYVHQYFKTPQEGGAIRSYHLAKGLVASGHAVTMITAHNGAYAVKKVDGIDVHYLSVRYDNRFGFLRRLWSFSAFVYLAIKETSHLEKHDLAYVMTTPLTTGFIAMYLKKRRGLNYYFEVGDLWPEVPVMLGVIKNNLLKRWLYSLEKKFYTEAEKIIALSPAIRDYIEKLDSHADVYVIPNMADCSFFKPEYREREFNEENKFRMTYCGAMGKANGLAFFIAAAKRSKAEGLPIHFDIMGYGSEMERLQAATQRDENITFHPHGGKEQVKQLLRQSDAVYVSFKDVDVLGTGSPNKFFDSLAAGKLTVINFNGWIRELIQKSKCGFYHAPHRPEDFIRKINVFLSAPELLVKYQQNGRKLAERYYDTTIQITQLLKMLDNR